MNKKTLLFVLLLLVSCPLAFSTISLDQPQASLNLFGGECKQIPITVKSDSPTALVVYAYYTTNLEDSTGLTITGENPFILPANGNKTLPLNVCTVPNFLPQSFDLNFYVDANIEQKDTIITQTQYIGGGTTYIYKDRNIDKNIYADRNIIIEIPKEIVKTITKEVPVEKIVTQQIEKRIEVPTTTNDVTLAILTGIICLVIGGVIVFIITKKGV